MVFLSQFPIYIIVICWCLISIDVVTVLSLGGSARTCVTIVARRFFLHLILADVITVLSLSGGARTCGTIVARMSIRPSHKHLPELPSRHSLQLFVVGIHLGTPLIAYGVVTGLY